MYGYILLGIRLGIRTLPTEMILFTFEHFSLDFSKRPHTNGDVFLIYKLMIRDSLPTILPSNKVQYRVSSEAYVALEHPPLNRGLTPSSRALKQSTPFVRYLSHF